MFMPGIPQVWYLDLFAGKNNYAAADAGGAGGHKEINRTTLTQKEIDEGLKRPVVLKQLELMRLRNTSPAFSGALTIEDGKDEELKLTWENGSARASLQANLKSFAFHIEHSGIEHSGGAQGAGKIEQR